jgi:hypothetical protein
MTLSTHEFIRRFLMHVLPKGVHRIRHYGLFANGHRAANIARARELLAVPPRVTQHDTDCPAEPEQPRVLPKPCPGKAIASTSALQSPQAPPRGQIPIASAAPPPPTSFDFEPWRFSDAGRHSPWITCHPGIRETCTTADIATLLMQEATH